MASLMPATALKQTQTTPFCPAWLRCITYRSGGHGLESDCQKAGDLYTQAADAAMAAMKGKMANKFYMLAEEAWAEVPDED